MTSPYGIPSAPTPTLTRLRPDIADLWRRVEDERELKENQKLYLETLRKYQSGDKSLRSELIRLHKYAPLSTIPTAISTAPVEEHKLGAYAQGMVERNKPTPPRQMVLQMDEIKRLLRSPVERVQFFTFLKRLFNANCDKSKSSDLERERLNLLTAQWESKYPVTRELFATVRGKGWKTEGCAATLRYFPLEAVSTVPTSSASDAAIVSSMLSAPPTSVPTLVANAPNAPNGVDGWW